MQASFDLFPPERPAVVQAATAAGPVTAGPGGLQTAVLPVPVPATLPIPVPAAVPAAVPIPVPTDVPLPLPVVAPAPAPALALAPAVGAGTLEQLHPGLWRAASLVQPSFAAGAAAHVGNRASGFAELDAQLPGHAWPAQALTELLLPHPGVGEMRLVAPVLAALQAQGGCLMFFDPPATPCPWALGALGIQAGRRLVVVRSRAALKAPARRLLPAADILWALEQTLKSGHAAAVLAWLPARLPADALRRLQLAAQAHDGPAFLLRDARERSRPSPAPLRLLLASAGPDRLQLHLLKRRGPPLPQPLLLSLPPVLLPDEEPATPAAATTDPLDQEGLP